MRQAYFCFDRGDVDRVGVGLRKWVEEIVPGKV